MTDDAATDTSHRTLDQVKRGGCLTAWLVFMIAANALSAATYLSNPGPALRQFPRLTPMLVVLLAIGAVSNVLLAILVWRWHRVGVYGLFGVAIVAFAVNLYVGLPVPLLAIGLAGPAVLALLVRRKWPQFS